MHSHADTLTERAGRWGGLVLGLCLLATPALHAEVPPSADEAAVQKHLGLFLTHRGRRDASERVQRNQERLEIWFLRSVPANQRDEVLCDGFRWLLAGRQATSSGVGALFAALSEIQEVVLVFYEVETRVEPQADGKYRQFRAAGPRARFAITREKAGKLKVEAIKGVLKGRRCVADGEAMVDTFWAKSL